jgi:hypothetical protein
VAPRGLQVKLRPDALPRADPFAVAAEADELPVADRDAPAAELAAPQEPADAEVAATQAALFVSEPWPQVQKLPVQKPPVPPVSRMASQSGPQRVARSQQVPLVSAQQALAGRLTSHWALQVLPVAARTALLLEQLRLARPQALLERAASALPEQQALPER